MNLREILSFSAGILAIVSSLPYIINTAKGKTNPNLVTWLTWTIIDIITAILAMKVHAVPTEIIAGASGVATLLIVCLSLKRGAAKYSTFDVICQVFAIVGIILWRVTNQPILAALITTAVSLFAVVPTMQHAWKEPLQETWETFGLGIVANLFTLASLTTFGLIAIASPVTFFICDMVLTGMILLRRQKLIWSELRIEANTAYAFKTISDD